MQPIVIYVPVICTDGIMEVDINILLKFEYFNRLLNTNIGSNKITNSKESDDKVTKYIFEIPHITVECSIQTFHILLNSETYWIEYDNDDYDDYLIELLLYNDMYMINKQIEGIMIYELGRLNISKLLNFIKQKLPENDPFDVLRKGSIKTIFINNLILDSFELASENKLDKNIIPDLLNYISNTLLRVGNNLDDFLFYILDVAILHYKEYPEIISSQITDKILSDILKNFVNDVKESYAYRKGSLDLATFHFDMMISKFKLRTTTMFQLGLISDINYDLYKLD